MSVAVEQANREAPDITPELRVLEVSDWIDVNAEILSFNRFTGQVLKRARQ